MVDLMRLWKDIVFVNDPRVKQVTTRFSAALALVVLTAGLVVGLGEDASQEGPGIETAAAPDDAACEGTPGDGAALGRPHGALHGAGSVAGPSATGVEA